VDISHLDRRRRPHEWRTRAVLFGKPHYALVGRTLATRFLRFRRPCQASPRLRREFVGVHWSPDHEERLGPVVDRLVASGWRRRLTAHAPEFGVDLSCRSLGVPARSKIAWHRLSRTTRWCDDAWGGKGDPAIGQPVFLSPSTLTSYSVTVSWGLARNRDEVVVMIWTANVRAVARKYLTLPRSLFAPHHAVVSETFRRQAEHDARITLLTGVASLRLNTSAWFCRRYHYLGDL